MTLAFNDAIMRTDIGSVLFLLRLGVELMKVISEN